MKNKPILLCLLFLTALNPAPLRAQPPASAPATAPIAAPQESQPHTIKMTIQPSAIQRPALKYKLLPDLVDQTPGNAVTLYLLSREFWPNDQKTSELLYPEKRRFDFQETPIDQFPRQYGEALLAGYAKTLKSVDVGARRREAAWDVGMRDGVLVRDSEALTRYLNDLKHVANLLSFRASFRVSQGDWSAASYSLQTTYGLARHVQNEPMLIHALLSAQFAEVATYTGIEEWISHGQSPNLYWSLTNLPAPFVDLRQAASSFDFEFLYWKPQLARALRGELSADQWQEVLAEMFATLQERRLPQKPQASVEAQVKKLIESAYPRAKTYLIANGLAEKAVQAMSAEEVVGTYICKEYSAAAEELRRAWTLPYWQAEPQMLASWKNIAADQAPQIENPLIQSELVSSPNRRAWFTAPTILFWRFELTRSDRRIAMMRTIEAIRDYAAHHDSQLPDRLEQITNVPLPLNPTTGKPFDYERNGKTAILEAPNPTWRGLQSGLRYELTIGEK